MSAKRSRRDDDEELNLNKKHAVDAELLRQTKPHRSSVLHKVTKSRHRDILPEMSETFKGKHIDYVFFLVSHGGGVDQGDKTVHFPPSDPPFGFSSNCDVIFQSSYGMCSHVANCDAILQNFKTTGLSELSGGRLIKLLDMKTLFTERKFRQYDAYSVDKKLVPNHYIFTAGDIHNGADCVIIYDVKTHSFLKDAKNNANIMLNNAALSSLNLKKRKQLRVRKKHNKRATHKYKNSTYVTTDGRNPTLFDLCNASTGTLRQLNFADKDFSRSEIAFVVGTCRVIGDKYRAHYSPTSWSSVSMPNSKNSQNSQNSQNSLAELLQSGLSESIDRPVRAPVAFPDAAFRDDDWPFQQYEQYDEFKYDGGKGKHHRKTHATKKRRNATNKHRNRQNETTKKHRNHRK